MPVTINAGTYNFGIFAATGGWNLNWWRITKTSGRIRPAAEPTENLTTDAHEFNFYPNPAIGELNVPIGRTPDRQIRIFNSKGEEVFSGKVLDEKIDLSSFPTGIYTIQSIENNKKSNRRLIKN